MAGEDENKDENIRFTMRTQTQRAETTAIYAMAGDVENRLGLVVV